MVRQIKLEQIDDLMKEAVQELVQKTTLKWTVLSKKATPEVTGVLKGAWQTEIKPLKGTIINNVEYAEPVIYRKQTIKGFPELQAKQLTTQYIPSQLRKIIRGM